MTSTHTGGASPALSEYKAELIMGVTIISLVVGALVTWVGWSINAREGELRAQVQERLELLANSRIEVLRSWLSGLAQQTDQLISSDLFRLYATDMDMIEADPSFLITGIIPEGAEHDQMTQLAEQLPLMQQTFADFTAFAGFLSGRIVHANGQSFIGSDARQGPITPQQAALIKKTLAYPDVHYSPLRQTENGLVIDIFAPIYSTAAEGGEKKAVAVAMMTKSATTNANALLSNTPLSARGERTRIIQESQDRFQEVVPWTPDGLKTLPAPPALDDAQNFPFAKRQALGGQDDVFSLGVRVPELGWWMVQEVAVSDASKGLQDYSRLSMFIAALIALVLCLLFGAIWWRTMGQNNKRLAATFQALALELEQQRNFLDSINNTIPDFIAVKDLSGAYSYANPALAAGVGRAETEVVGLDDAALFGFDTGKRLELSDEQALKADAPVTVNERIFLKSTEHHFQITKITLKDDASLPRGVVSIFRDITAMVRAEERKRQSIQQTIEALVKAIEFTDPYLAGHSVLMRDLASLLADILRFSPTDKATVEIASHLSQIGKMFVSKALLTKATPLTEEEKQQVQKHVDHAGDILRQIDFELPVFEAVYQMNESLDGSGYPRGLHGEDISEQARLLSVANSFCAMIRPRAYRPALSPEVALETLRSSASHYDMRIVDALEAALRTALGAKILEKAKL